MMLIKLHRDGNPTSSDAEFIRNVKRKFLNGISSEVKMLYFVVNPTIRPLLLINY